MIVLLSPAKTLDYSSPDLIKEPLSMPAFSTEANKLVKGLKKMSLEDIKSLMHISDALASENYNRYKNYSPRFVDDKVRSAISAFQGDVYQGLDASTLDIEKLRFANEHVRILSGLYGILKPFDKMQAYRLEMGTKYQNEKGKNLYEYWGDSITRHLNKELKKMNSETIVNLASNEYFKVINKKMLKANIIEVDFREDKDGELKFVSFFAKKARGLMTRYILDHQIENTEHLKGFDYENYAFSEEHSSNNSLVFVR